MLNGLMQLLHRAAFRPLVFGATCFMFGTVFGCQREAKSHIVKKMFAQNTQLSDSVARHWVGSDCERN
jgi:hypothetical protein